MAGVATGIGSRGEDIAVEWLRSNGFYIVERNWRAGYYEIDIIAQRWDTLHIVEVKTRHASSWHSAADSIDSQKIRNLRRATSLYRMVHRSPLLIQFDLISVVIDDHGGHTVEYIENIL
ncbi:MAG: YraN family protein [Alistipes sp.]|nr:YraN family protein [Alistipes sp.]